MNGEAHSPNLLLTFIHKSDLSSCEDPDFWIRHIKLSSFDVSVFTM